MRFFFMLQYLKFHRVKQLNNPLYYRITLQERLLNILCLSSLLNSLNVIFDDHINESSKKNDDAISNT